MMDKELFPEWYVDVKNLSPNWVTKNFLDFMNLKVEDLKGRNVASIWWWLGIFEIDVAKAWAKVTAIDPLYLDDEWIDKKFKENIDWLDEKLSKWSKRMIDVIKNNIMKALDECKDDSQRVELEERLYWYKERKSELDEYARRREELLAHLKNWKNNQKKFWLILNPSSWDNIVWIDDGSQDMVIIWHTLSHIYNKWLWNIDEFLREWLRILKDDGKLWIIDYTWENKNFEDALENTDLKKYFKVNKWSFVCCFDKKWLSKFLEMRWE